MLNLETLAAKLTLQGVDFQTGIASARKQLDGLADHFDAVGKRMQSAGRTLSLAVTAPLVGFGVVAVNAASDLAEAQSAVGTVYGESADQIAGYSGSVAGSLGLARDEALSTAATFGVFGKQAGFTGQDLVDFSNDSLQAAADLASFYNAPVPEALAAIQSGLSGETEPLRQFGIFLNEATVQQYALENGIWDGVGAMTEQQKIAARSGYILDNLGDAQGDFARTSGGLANQQRILKARFRDVAATVGKYLLPAVLKIVGGLAKLFDKIESLSPSLLKWGVIIGAAAAAMGPLLIALGYLVSAFAPVIAVLAFILSPIGLLVAGLALLAFHFRGPIISGLKTFVGWLQTLGQYLKFVWEDGDLANDFLTHFPEPIQRTVHAIGSLVDVVHDLVEGFQRWGMDGFLRRLPGELHQAGQAFEAIGEEIMQAIRNIPWDAIWQLAIDLLKGAASVGIDLGEFAVTGILALGGKLKEWAGNLYGWLKVQLFGDAVSGDGTGGPEGAASTISFGSVVVEGLLALGGMLKTWAGNLWGWVKEQLGTNRFGGPVGDGTGGPEMDRSISIGDVLVSIGKFILTGLEKLGDFFRDLAGRVSLASIAHWLSDPIELSPSIKLNLEKAGEAATKAALSPDFWYQAMKVGAMIAAITAALAVGLLLLPIIIPFVIGVKFGPAFISAVWSLLKGAFNGVVDKVKEFDWSGITTAISDGVGGALSTLQSSLQWLYDWASPAIDKLTGALDTIGVPDALNALKSVLDGIQSAMQWIHDHASWVPGFGNGGSKDEAPEGWEDENAPEGGTPLAKAMSAFPGKAAAFAEAVSESLSKVKDAFEGIRPPIDAAVSHAGAAQESFHAIFAGIATNATNMAQIAGQGFRSMLAAGLNTAVSHAGAAQQSFASIFSGIATSATNLGMAAGQGFLSGIRSGTSQAVGAAQSARAQILGALSLPSLFSSGYNVGLSLAQGIAAGIQSAVSSIANAAANAVNQAEAAARLAADAHSPSRLFMKLGDDLVAGMMLPLERAEPQLSGWASTALSGGGGYGVAGYGTGDISVALTVQGDIYGVDDLRRTVIGVVEAEVLPRIITAARDQDHAAGVRP